MSSQGIHKRPVRRVSAALVAVALSLAATIGATLLGAAPASAHDEFLSADPAADATVESLPAEITLTFSGLISTEEGANEIAVTDASGASLVEGEPSVSDTVVTQRLTTGAASASGAVTVLWKVVSSDGHPISGEYSFTVTGAPTPTPTASSSPTESASPAEPVETPSATATPTTAPTEASSSGAVWPWVVGGLVVLAVAAALIYLLTSRSRRERALAEGRDPAGPAASGGGSEPPLDR
ncbi:copper resistance CopC family protein [Microbacterium sp. 4R-513]|uniref:copper resistance CopC family protein n=1 Tax=Microbacterium sp. 4R-513 TaxID=2567934 RepID=UPI001F4A0735|nr:copper resistance CopC family protein [Microbacterium sp. 4R-513]